MCRRVDSVVRHYLSGTLPLLTGGQILAFLFFCLATTRAASAQNSPHPLESYMEKAGRAVLADVNTDGRALFKRFRGAVVAEAKRDGNKSIADGVAALRQRREIPATLRPLAARLLRGYFVRQYGERLGEELGALLRFRTVAEGGKENWQLPEFIQQREWLERKSVDFGLKFKSYDGRVEEITLHGNGPTIAVLTHGDVVGVEKQEWSSPPWKGRIVDGKIIGRGAMDNKGPIVSVLYALAALRDTGWKLNADLKLLVANGHETGREDVQYYKQKAAVPKYTIGMDASFPVTFEENGAGTVTFRALGGAASQSNGTWKLISVRGGFSPTSFADRAEAILEPKLLPITAFPALERSVHSWTTAFPLARIQIAQVSGQARIVATGKAGSSVNSEGSRNALSDLLAFLASLDLEMNDWGVLAKFLGAAPETKNNSGALGMMHRSDAAWAFTLNLGVVREQQGTPTALVGVKIPVGIATSAVEAEIAKSAANFSQQTGSQISATLRVIAEPHPVPPELVANLLQTWEEVTGTRKAPVVMGGVLHSREFPGGVDFGPAFSPREDRGHAADEYMTLRELRLLGELTIDALLRLI